MTNLEKLLESVPNQVGTLIKSMLGSPDNIHIRGNYRSRLLDIRNSIDAAISQYDREASMHVKTKKKA
jgi:hypothetical protein